MDQHLDLDESVYSCGRAARALEKSRGFLKSAGSRIAPLLALILVLPAVASAQGNALPVRVTDRVDVSRMTTLSGNTHPLAQAKYDQGAAPPDLPMNRILMVLKRSAAQEAALQDLLTQQQIASSPNFHKWLTPDQFGQQFGVADSDIQAVTSWLGSFGFQSIKVGRGKNVIEFSGTAAQVQAALHTPIHKYVVNGENHWANASDPQVPAALAPVIAGFASLHDFHPKPTLSKLNRNRAGTVTQNGQRPQINFSDGSHGLVPADFNTIYNVNAAMTGAGTTIGIIGNTNINPQDVADFRARFLGGSSANFSSSNIVVNGPDPGVFPGSPAEGEAVLDATWSGAVAPQATIKLVVSEDTNAANGTDLSEFYIIDNNLADVMTESFSVCELVFAQQGFLTGPQGAAAFYSGLAEQAAAQGITLTVASGDGGPDSCDDPSVQPASTTTPSVNLLASTPFDVAVGGTMFNDIASPSTYWNSTNDPTTRGSAKSYIPENVWNESCTTAGPNCPAVGLWSSGGGASIEFGASLDFPSAPPWQGGVTGLPLNHPRLVPDVALNAADHDGYVLCIDQSCQGVGCPPPGTGPCFSIASGTSASAQAFGGIMALVVQKVGRVGIANYALYKMAGNETYANCNGSNTSGPPQNTCVFNDVTVGNTNIPGETGFTAAVGYDETTGLGSVNVTNLVNGWSSAITAGTTTTLSLNNGNAVSIVHGFAVPVNITVAPVAPATGTPTGDVSLLSSNSATDHGIDGFTLFNGSVSASSNSTILLPGGSYQVHAHYEGDGKFLGSDSSSVNVTVTPEASRTIVGIVAQTSTTCTTKSSVIYGSPYVLTVVVADVNAGATACQPNESGSSPTGTVTLTDSFNGGAAAPLDGGTFKLNSFGLFEDQTIQLAVGTHAINAAYSGDPSFNASTTNNVAVTVTKAPTTAAVTGPSTATANTAFTLTVTVDTQTSSNPPIGSNGAAPTGMVTFTATTAAGVLNPERRPWIGPGSLLVGEISIALACLFLLAIAGERQRGRILLGSSLAVILLFAASCGSSNSSGGGSNTTTLGTATLTGTTDANGFAEATASLPTAKLAANATITATYSGDANYSGSTSSAITVTVH